MHGTGHIKFANAQQAKQIHQYKNIKQKLYTLRHERFFCRSGETAAVAAGMERSVLSGSERTDDFFTAAFK